ncbi:MAG: segregation/condensation protein A [Cytophagales bacterium]
MSFEIKLPLFEGPFDLLLFFIERDELDIYDIPISKITKDFLEYLQHLEQLNMDVASEFIWVAASLMKIKSKLLLPRPELDEEGNEIDPREELVKHLLEYKRYKSVVEDFKNLESSRINRESRGNLTDEIKSLYAQNNVEAELQSLDLYKLLKVYQKVVERYEYEKNLPKHEVREYPYTIEKQRKYILTLTRTKEKVSFVDVISTNPDKVAVIFNFLAILELLQMNHLKITIGEGYNNFWISKGDKVTEDLEN